MGAARFAAAVAATASKSKSESENDFDAKSRSNAALCVYPPSIINNSKLSIPAFIEPDAQPPTIGPARNPSAAMRRGRGNHDAAV